MMPAIRNDAPASPYAGAANRLEGLFDRFFGEEGPAVAGWYNALPLAIWEDDEAVHVEADLPGVAEPDIEVTVHNGTLFLRGERRAEAGRRYLYNSRASGRFERIVTLPAPVDVEAIRAELAHGVLRLTLPKAAEARPRRVRIGGAPDAGEPGPSAG